MSHAKALACAVFAIGWAFTLLGVGKLPERENTEWRYWADIPLTYEEQEALHNAADEMGVPYELACSVVWKETTFRNIYGDGGAAYGYMQVHPSQHWDRMQELGVTDLFDPASNFRVGCHYLAELLNRYGDTHMALMAYNAGPGNADIFWFSEGIYTNEYSREVINFMNETFYNGEIGGANG